MRVKWDPVALSVLRDPRLICYARHAPHEGWLESSERSSLGSSFILYYRLSSGLFGSRFPQANDLIRLRSFASFNNVELDFIAFLQAFVAVNLDRTVMHEDICSTIAP